MLGVGVGIGLRGTVVVVGAVAVAVTVSLDIPDDDFDGRLDLEDGDVGCPLAMSASWHALQEGSDSDEKEPDIGDESGETGVEESYDDG